MNRDEFDKAVADAKLDVASGAAATTAGIVLGANPILATVVGASGPALKLVHRLSSRWAERRQDRAARALDRAAEILDVGLDIIEERATSHDPRLELLARVLEAAARTPLEAKITALASVLAEGLREDGSIDESLVLAAALGDIEAPHVFVLDYLVANPLPPEETWPAKGAPHGWEVHQIAQALPTVAEVLDGLIAVLAGHGLIRSQGGSTWGSVGASSMYATTSIGRRCLLLLGKDVPEPESEPS